MPPPNPDLQGPEKITQPSENQHAHAFTNAQEENNQSTPNNVVNAADQWSSDSEIELAVSSLNDFLSGAPTVPSILDTKDPNIRKLVAAELLAAITSLEREAPSWAQVQSPLPSEQQDDGELDSAQDLIPGRQKRERARQLFTDYGYLDDAINSLRATESSADRVEAARILGIVGSKLGTAPLIAALFDAAPEVRQAAEDALGQIGDPSVSIDPISTMTSRAVNYETPSVVESKEAKIASDAEAAFDSETAAEAKPASSTEADSETPAETEPASSEEADSYAEAASAEESEIGSSAESAILSFHSEKGKFALEQITAKDTTADAAGISSASEDLDRIRQSVVEVERQLVTVIAARKDADTEALVRAEQESAFRGEAAARRREDEEARKRAEEKAARRRLEDDRKMAAEQLGRLQAELEAQRLAEDEERLRVEVASLKQAVDEMIRQRAELEANERDAVVDARRLEAEDSLRKAEERHNAELKRLRSEEEALYRATERANAQRIEVEAERREAETQVRRFDEEKKQLAEAAAARDAEAQRLRGAEAQAHSEQEELHRQVEAMVRMSEEIATRRAEIEAQGLNALTEVEQLQEEQERMQGAERIRREAQEERLQLEAELSQQVEKEQSLLAEIRRQAEDEQQRLEEAFRLRTEEQDQRLAELETTRAELEAAAQQRSESEHRLNLEIEGLRAAEREALTRIGQAESLRTRAEDTHHVAAEKVQRIEAEARRRTMEDQRVLDKLEETRRNLELEAYGRAEQEKHLKEEIELLRSLEKEERQRIAEISSSRAEAEVRLHRERERLKLEEEALAKTEAQIEFLLDHPHDAEETAQWSDYTDKNLQAEGQPAIDNVPVVLTDEFSFAAELTPVLSGVSNVFVSPESWLLELKSADPDKRMAALASLSRHGKSEAFGLIASCFDDPSPQVRNAAARALRDREPDRTVESFTRAIEEGSPERGRNIGVAIAASGLASEALRKLSAESREDTYKALSLLFVMAKTGEIQPLTQAIEEYPEPDVCNAAVKLLNLGGQSEAAEAALQRRRERRF